MSKRPALFTEADVKRAIKATQAAGLPVGEVKIEKDGSIRVIVRAGDLPGVRLDHEGDICL